MSFEFQRWMNNLLARLSKPLHADAPQSPAETWHLRMMREASQQLAGELAPARLIELSRSDNGFAREGALRALSGHHSAEALQAIIERVNDWVPVVRKAARQAFESYLEPAHAHLLLRRLDDVVQLETRHRDDHAALLQRVGAVLSQGVLRAQACATLLQLRGRAGRYLFRVLYPADPDARCELVAKAMCHDDLTVRSLAVQHIAELPDEAVARLLATAFRDPVPALRSRALGMLLSRHATDVERRQWAERGAVDRSAGARELARWYAGKFQIDLSSLRCRLDSQSHRPATETIALLELNGAAGIVNLRLLEASLEHPFATVRRAALACVVRQAPQLAASALRRALLDPSNKVFRLASDTARKLNVGITAEDLLDVCKEALAQQAVRRAVDWPQSEMSAGKVLVVEDNPVNRKVAELLLKKLGLEFLSVENGQEAIDILRNGERPNLILMDMQMPVMDGITATQHIRVWEKETHRVALPIVAMTANAFEEDSQRCREAGMDDFLAKPVNLEALKTIVVKWRKAADA